ncbi:MAG: ribosome biogenesis/translation initiation ATPase RLI [archaeon]|nr:ribosome biogenesis/translation initiation ATPase RLI [archaeon]MDD2477932.1 ribosome biogenesis/translation initiation ATPase RLI [Candidatus ainarchaeum sp.]MDD3084441.1 ribosome biogenesis/translation initiation ATPase RLI [Candidatus ainarchaeum sp.]MDD4220903.1 ribosome biogenesis/translation initiation ATPase RLI [Candidatus ainarchaeum sp.]MDD4662917.1 ribosome biogenesis/translation initiation ATPase RLI [Candidatus ainarchaeum sp.]
MKPTKTQFTRIAIIDKDKCQPKACNYLCHRVCPPVRMGEDAIEIINSKNYTPPIINEELCTGCGICPNKCPFGAIQIINTGVKFSEPIHQFGKNSFRLYSLPTPEKGMITGIIGRNGAGKTTAINILSGNLIPNLGEYEAKGDISKVIDYYKGKNIQKQFIDIKNKELKFAYKIQKVEEIPKLFDNKIIELLKQITNDEQKLEKIVKDLDLEKLINKKTSQVSGGELQRVAIAATLLKDANLYFLDEYTTFLDIKQRLKIAKILREKLNENNSIVLVEHDLAILDYVSDYVQIMFGTKNAYGLSSNKKTTKKGINEFLEGFLKEENIRIRNHRLEFSGIKATQNKTSNNLVQYPKFEKTLGEFKLKVDSGKINKAEIIGILGPNATGKTTFIKVLAGEIKADNKEIDTKLKISYKPQYIDIDKDLLVSDLFTEKGIDVDLFNSEIRNQLDLEKIIFQKIEELSGGELQKVAVAYCLSKEADLYLLDEPSAFLDIEQRVIIANVIKSVINKKEKSALIVDHDLLFIDYISDRVLLFEGKPSVNGHAQDITTIAQAYNKFLKEQDITFRQDPDTKRPRANKHGSQKDQEQKKENKYYFTI